MCYILHMSNIHPSWAIMGHVKLLISVHHRQYQHRPPPPLSTAIMSAISMSSVDQAHPQYPQARDVYPITGLLLSKTNPTLAQSATITSCKCSADCPEIGSSCIVKIAQLVPIVQVCKSVWQIRYCDMNCNIVVL